MRLKNTIIAFILLFLIVSYFPPAPLWASDQTRNVLILHSYHSKDNWTHDIYTGMHAVLDHSDLGLEIYLEYMDTKRYPPEQSFAYLDSLYTLKYQNFEFDVILASDNNALDFLLSKRDRLFPNVPIVFCGINDFQYTMIEDHSQITGINESIDVAATIRLAKQLFPNTRHIITISDQTPTGHFNRAKFKAALPELKDLDIKFEYWDNSSVDELTNNLRNLSDDTILLLLTFHRDKYGHWFNLSDYIELIQENSNAPIFSLWNHYLGKGIVGGVLTDGTEQGRKSAEYAIRILNGESADDLPVILQSPNITALDDRQIQHFHIPQSRIPNHTKIFFQSESLFKRYRVQIIAIVNILLIMSATIIFLLVNISSRKRAEKQLSDALLRQNELVRASNIGLWDRDLITHKVHYSDEWKRQLGYEPDEISDDIKEWEHLVHPDDMERAAKNIQECMTSSKNHISDEFRLRHKDKSYHWILMQASVIRDKTGKPARLLGSHIDITERKAMEISLRQSEAMHRAIFERSPLGIFIVNLENSLFVNFNSIGCDLYGYSKEEMASLGPDDLIVENSPLSDPLENFMDTIKNGQDFSGVFVNKRKDGAEIIIQVVGTPLKYHGENCALAIVQDVTARNKAQADLQESEQKLRYILDSMPDMILEVNSELEVLWANKTALRLNPNAVGQTCYSAFPGNTQVCDGCYCEKAFETKQIEMGVMYQPKSKTAGESYWENIGVPLKDKNGNVRSMLEVSRDVTEREMSRKRELKLQRDLFQAQKMESIGNLAGGIAHDFNNILSSIIGFTELAIEDAEKGSALEDSLLEVYTAGKRARDLVKQILAFARQSEEKRKPVQPGLIAKEVLQFIRSTIPTTIDIRQDIQSDSMVLGNTTQLYQVFMNLCTNAAQAMEEDGGTLNVTVADIRAENIQFVSQVDLFEKDYVEIKIKDSGIGIPPDVIHSIFEPYYTTKATGKGTGMGLAVVQGIVESYGGHIHVESEFGSGTCFRLYLPVTRTLLAQKGGATKQTLPTGDERILFVDDEEALAKMAKRMLSSLGYSVTIQTNSREALALFKSRPEDFDLVISDMTMPHLPGDKLAEELMTIRTDIPIIICTGYSKRLSEETALEIGIKAFAYKPVVKAELAKTVRMVLDKTTFIK